MANFVDITTYTLKRGDKFLIDANVLLYLFYTAGNYRKDIVRKYSTFYVNIIKNDCKILLPLNLITEFANRFYKLEFEEYLNSKGLKYNQFKFKEYKATKEFSTVMKDVLDIFELQIIPYGEKVDYNFKAKKIEDLLMQVNKMDLNDIVYYDIAKELNIPIITNDKDFGNISDISVITTNTYLLNIRD